MTTIPAGSLDITRTQDQKVLVRRADPEIAVSAKLMTEIELGQHSQVTRRGDELTICGIAEAGYPVAVLYRISGFEPTAAPDANEGGFHLLDRVA